MDGALRHRVAPLMLKTLDPDNTPPSHLDELRRRAISNARRSLAWLAEADRLLRALNEAGIRALILKGCALSLQLYGTPSLRQCGDIDLLIEPRHLWAADTILRGCGYRGDAGTIPDAARPRHENWLKDLSYSDGRWHVELHHRLADNPLLLPYDFEALWTDRETVICGGLSFPVPSRRFAALYLCVHGAGHDWERLGWLADIATLLREGAAQVRALDDAREAGLWAVMVQSLHLAHDWLGLPLFDPRLRLDAAAKRRLRRFVSTYSPGSEGGLKARWGREERRDAMILRCHLARYGMRSGLRYRLRQVLADLASPQDWQTFPLPRALSWLYPVLRPVGWVLRHGGKGSA